LGWQSKKLSALGGQMDFLRSHQDLSVEISGNLRPNNE
jgi:hypothetical protein